MHYLFLIRIIIALFATTAAYEAGPHTVSESGKVDLRWNLINCLHKFERKMTGHVAFPGGSITEIDGYRPRVEVRLTTRFPETKFTFTNAGIASTCSHTGAFRLERDVLNKGPVDLLPAEFAVNDDQDVQHSADDCICGMEGIVRHLCRWNPQADVVMNHFVNPGMLATAQAGSMQLSVLLHELVARHYCISSINLPVEVADRIKAGSLTWQAFGGTHPGPTGNQPGADLVTGILTAGWNDAAKPQEVIGEELLSSDHSGASLSLKFDGTAIGACALAGPEAGQQQVRIDGNGWNNVGLFHGFSPSLHYPGTVMFATDVKGGLHAVEVRAGIDHHLNSRRHAARIISFAADDSM